MTLRRVGFGRYEVVKEANAPLRPATRRAVYSRCDAAAAPMPKDEPLQHLAYMAVVRKLPCAHCGIPGPCEFAHSDQHKGQGIKSDCRLGSPLCHACHVAIGTTRIYPKVERRSLEEHMAANTRKLVNAQGSWPASLPQWEEQA